MLVCELAGQTSLTLISQSKLWLREIESLQPLDLKVFLRLHRGLETAHQALREVQHLVDESWVAVVEDRIAVPPRIAYFDPSERARITVQDICEWLVVTTVPRRAALLFALETGMSISDVVTLTWNNMKSVFGVSEYAKQIIKAQPRHLRVGCVFWESYENGIVGPLFALEETAEDVAQGLGFNRLRELYEDCLPIHGLADLDAFTSTLCETYDRQLTLQAE